MRVRVRVGVRDRVRGGEEDHEVAPDVVERAHLGLELLGALQQARLARVTVRVRLRVR